MTPPPCDRHKNLQMVPFGRCHDDQGYFEVVEGQLVREGKGAPNRIVEAREKILKTIRARAGA
jgi:hypothetical protein